MNKPPSIELDERPVVTIFGSGSVTEESSFWQDAETLGRLLAEEGYHICNGGYAGTMEATAKGAETAGGTERIGILCKDLADSRVSNPHLTQSYEADTVIERLSWLTETADAFIALPGSMGTVIEVMMAWNYPQVKKERPLILMGAVWQQLIPGIIRLLNLHPNYLHIPLYCVTPEEAIRILKKKLNPPTEEPANETKAEKAEASEDSEEKAEASEEKAEVSEEKAEDSEEKAEVSEEKAEASEEKAEASEEKAEASEEKAEASEETKEAPAAEASEEKSEESDKKAQ